MSVLRRVSSCWLLPLLLLLLGAASANALQFNSIHSFNGLDGSLPSGSVIQGSDGALYGTTQNGGSPSYRQYGTVFRLALDGSTFTTLHNFNLSDGAYPDGGVIQGSNGALYGTTFFGGSGNTGEGTVFSLSLADTTPPVLTASANPSVLWPANGKMVNVTVTGQITDDEPVGSGVDTGSGTSTTLDN